MTKQTVVDLDQNEINVLLFALESLTEDDGYYLSERFATDHDLLKKRLETISKNMG